MSKKKKKTSQEENRQALESKFKRFTSKFLKSLSRRNLIIGVIVAVFLIQFIQMQRLMGFSLLLENRDSSLITEIGEIKDSYTKIGTDLSEVRQFLRMPETNYTAFTEIEVGGDSAKNSNEVQLAFFEYISYLSDTEKLEERLTAGREAIRGLFDSLTFYDFLVEQELSYSEILEDEDRSYLEIYSGDTLLLTYSLNKDDGRLYLETLEQSTELETADFEKNATTFIKNQKKHLLELIEKINIKKTAIFEALNADEVQKILINSKISVSSEAISDDTTTRYEFFNKSGDFIGKITVDNKSLEITLTDDKGFEGKIAEANLVAELVTFLGNLNTLTFIEQKVEHAGAELKETVADKGFRALLEKNGLKLGEMREDEDRIYYDIFGADDKHLSSLVVEKATGVINIVEPDGTNAENLLFFDPDFKKKTLEIPDFIPEFGNEVSHMDNTFNILIAGKHGSLVDTMIFAHIDEDKGTVRMISVPRDLYYNGRKINAFAHYYGMSELKKVLSNMTGYELDKYILIDMYAFIDVIDLIGGIDVTLTKSVIDPTYRTVDNGVEGTLHYEPGDYHLGGKEALRLARSRHTSSDFARAERQQLILEALQDKAKNFGFGDADTIYEISKTVLDKTETDISLDEAITYYFRYQNFKIESNAVMSSGNVLYVPPYITVENCNKLIEAAEAAGEERPDCENENHAYTLLPRNDNWNVVKWFFREEFPDFNNETPAI